MTIVNTYCIRQRALDWIFSVPWGRTLPGGERPKYKKSMQKLVEDRQY